jgi:hypothetical protein
MDDGPILFLGWPQYGLQGSRKLGEKSRIFSHLSQARLSPQFDTFF